MPTSKRERQRSARQARREAEAAAFRRTRARKRVTRLVLVSLMGLGLAYFVYDRTKPEGTQVATDSTSTTTTSPLPQAPCPPAEGSAERTDRFSTPPMCIDPAKSYTALVETDIGSYSIELFADRAPATVNNFVFLARNRFYEGTIFHRVIPGFVVQGGSNTEDGGSGPGYLFADELPEAGQYEIGSVVMANRGPDTNSSGFFVVTGPEGVALPPTYSLFGKVVEGLDVVKQIESVGSPSGTPSTSYKILKVSITES